MKTVNQVLKMNLSAVEKLILIYLLNVEENEKLTIYRIRKDLGNNIDYRTINKAISGFISQGIITVTGNVYKINTSPILTEKEIFYLLNNDSKINSKINKFFN